MVDADTNCCEMCCYGLGHKEASQMGQKGTVGQTKEGCRWASASGGDGGWTMGRMDGPRTEADERRSAGPGGQRRPAKGGRGGLGQVVGRRGRLAGGRKVPVIRGYHNQGYLRAGIIGVS